MCSRFALLGFGVVMLAVVSVPVALAQNNNRNSPIITNNPTVAPVIAPSALGGAGGNATASPRSRSNANAAANPSAGASSGSSAVSITTGNTTNQNPPIPGTAPTVYIPSVSTGNVCALGASVGGSFIAGSFGFGVSWESMQCERRQAAALLWNMGTPESRAAAKEVLCNTPELRNAYRTVGSPCAADMMQVSGKAEPGQPSAPTFVPPPPVFDAKKFASVSDCLTAAYQAHADLALCGRR